MRRTSPLLRSVLYAPGSNPKILDKAPNTGADALILDLEDSVAPNAKVGARDHVLDALRQTDGLILRTVRINDTRSDLWRDDLQTILDGRPNGIVVPKVERAEALLPVIELLSRLEKHDSRLATTPIWAMIESPLGVINAYAIACQTRVTCLVMGTSDLTKELRLHDTKDRKPLHFALQQTILAARAANVTVLDGVFLDLNDPTGFAVQCQEGEALGFDGKTVIHPSQVEPANLAFFPTEAEIARARRIIHAWESAYERGEEICVVDGRLVERLHAREAGRLIALWEKYHVD